MKLLGLKFSWRLLGGSGGLLTIILLLFEPVIPAPKNLVSYFLEQQEAVEIATVTPTATATETAVPPTSTPLPQGTATPTFTPTSSPTPEGWDYLEPNDTWETATIIAVGASFNSLTLNPIGDVDYFTIFAKKGQILSITTFVQPGADTKMALFSESRILLQENDDKSPTDLGSEILWASPSDQWVYIQISSAVPGFGGTYSLAVTLESPTPTPTPTLTPTHVPTVTPQPTWTTTPAPVLPDQYEPNNTFEDATEMVQGSPYQATLPRGDVDYYRFVARQSIRYRCETANLQGVDTAMTVYEANQTVIGENENRSATDISSMVEWVASYTGSHYVVIRGVIGHGSYTVTCSAVVPPPPPSGGGGGPIAPTTIPTSTPEPTGTPVNLTGRFLYQVNPTATPSIETVIRIRVAYDANNNRTADLNEGVSSISVRALVGGRVVAWALTDERGEATLRVLGDVDRVTIPYLSGWESRVRAGEAMERVVIIPAVQIPVVIPVIVPTPVNE